jgi:hypothetical protein
MPTSATTTPASSAPKPNPETAAAVVEEFIKRFATRKASQWSSTTIAALAVLVAYWGVWFYATWASWGNVSIDCGREMYVPSVLAEGKTLYRDVWYLYGPAAPYFNSWLYRLFGVHLNVLYWAGSLSALGSAIFLFLSGMRLSSWTAGWTAGAILLTQSFQTTLFSFPLPYSFASVYGCLTACALLWLMLRALHSKNWVWVFASGTAAALALLLKIEFGVACYAGLLGLIVLRALRHRSGRSLAVDFLATLPGIALCTIVLFWMVSINGIKFLLNENLAAFPSSYFMHTYGKFWLEDKGLLLTPGAFAQAAFDGLILFAIAQGVWLAAGWGKLETRWKLMRACIFLGAIVYVGVSFGWRQGIAFVFFPHAMVLYVAMAAGLVAWYFLRNPASAEIAALTLTLGFSTLIAARVLLQMMPVDYPIYYDGAAVLSFLLVSQELAPRFPGAPRFAFFAKYGVCAGCLLAAIVICVPIGLPRVHRVDLVTERGTVRLTDSKAERYAAAIQFMQEKQKLGEKVLSIPEDTSLYFLSGTPCPTRVCTFTPGIVVPGKMSEELIQEVERQRVRYLLWSNRVFPEYRAPRFGIDFDREFGEYLTKHYRRVGPITPSRVSVTEWTAFIWERLPDTEIR